jgi:cysteine desulfuration protein SufE
MIKLRKEKLLEDLGYLEQDQIFEYLIDHGQRFSSQPEWASDANKVPGCISRLWVGHDMSKNSLIFKVCSDSRLVDGTARVIVSLVDGCNPGDVVDELDELDSMPSVLGLSMQRRNGTSYLISCIKGIVRSCR